MRNGAIYLKMNFLINVLLFFFFKVIIDSFVKMFFSEKMIMLGICTKEWNVMLYKEGKKIN